ncbi:hypothetical protein ABH926_002418 [Catenulispora sp. GP43]|uniref:hypothetical protein n=1 Tax=Catenulispora sp. GP43 TaxID=3156263 RepID=UPI003516A577
MLSEHRSGRLVAWGNAWLAGHTSLDSAAEQVRADGDEPHRVAGVPGEDGEVGWTVALGRLRAAGVTGLRLALPRPGDPLGLKGPAAFNQAAIAAGEAVLTDGTALGIVPSVDGYGPAGDRGHAVRWTVTAVPDGAPATPTLSEAERELNAALREAAEELARLDVARWRPELAESLAAIRGHGRAPEAVLAPGYPPRAVKVLTQAQRLAAIADLAGQDEGGSVTALESRLRASALVGLERVTRRAQLAAYHSILEPGVR